jgi:hypothetical protein
MITIYINGFSTDETSLLFGKLNTFAETKNICKANWPDSTSITLTVGDLLLKQYLLRDYFSSENQLTFDSVMSLLPKILPLDAKIELDWS